MSRDWLQGLRGKICRYINPVFLLLYCHLLCFPSDATCNICLAVSSVTIPRLFAVFPPSVDSSAGNGQGTYPAVVNLSVRFCAMMFTKKCPKKARYLRFEIMLYINSAEKLLLFLRVLFLPFSLMICYVCHRDMYENDIANCFSCMHSETPSR